MNKQTFSRDPDRWPLSRGGSGADKPLRLYAELAAWWPLFSPPSHYVEEAADLLPVLMGAPDSRPRTLLELGSGGGSFANHLKSHLELTLSDRSREMLAISGTINPECEHVLGDMRSMRLRREFDLVLIHDAIMYATDPASVRAALRTAHTHCRPGGAVIVIPDFVRETFEPKTSTGGEDGADGRGLRYLQWVWDPDPEDETYEVAWAFLLREPDGATHVDGDRHRFGLFPRDSWLSWMREAGLATTSRIDPWERDVFVGVKPRSDAGNAADPRVEVRGRRGDRDREAPAPRRRVRTSCPGRGYPEPRTPGHGDEPAQPPPGGRRRTH